MSTIEERTAAETFTRDAFDGLVAYVYAVLDNHPPEIPFGALDLTEEEAVGYEMHSALLLLGIDWIKSLGGVVSTDCPPPATWVRHADPRLN